MRRSQLVIELASDAQFSRDLSAGGVFIPGCALPLAEECDVLVCGADHELLVPARVVYVDEYRGAGLELIGFSPELKARLAALEPAAQPAVEVIDEAVVIDPAAERAELPREEDLSGSTPIESVPLIDVEALADDLADDLAIAIAPAPRTTTPARSINHASLPDPGWLLARARTVGLDAMIDPEAAREATHERAHEPAHEPAHEIDPDTLARTQTVDLGTYAGATDDAYSLSRTQTVEADPSLVPAVVIPLEDLGTEADDADDAADADAARDPASLGRAPTRNVHERLRGLTLAAQQKIAATGELHERIALERQYGKNVWDTLLRNPRLTAPEVSRIARYGALPRVLLELIVGNATWLGVPEVRRALLANPRLTADQIARVLRLTPKHELRLAATQTAYPYAVRTAARQLMTRDE